VPLELLPFDLPISHLLLATPQPPLSSYQLLLSTAQSLLPHCQLAAGLSKTAVGPLRSVPDPVHGLPFGHLLGPHLTLPLHPGQTLSDLLQSGLGTGLLDLCFLE